MTDWNCIENDSGPMALAVAALAKSCPAAEIAPR